MGNQNHEHMSNTKRNSTQQIMKRKKRQFYSAPLNLWVSPRLKESIEREADQKETDVSKIVRKALEKEFLSHNQPLALSS